MTLRKITHISFLVSLAVLLLAFIADGRGHRLPTARADSDEANPNCAPVGGSIITNLGVIDQNTTLGMATGDLRGAVGATILSVSQGPGNTTLFHVQHHWVTESGDTIFIDKTTATTTQVAPGLFAVLTYPVHFSGGTGKYNGATGDLTAIGEADLNTGHTVFRYSGKVCFAEGLI